MSVVRAFVRSQATFPAALAVTVVIALLPSPWLAWTSGPAELLGFVVQPLSSLGQLAGSWIRQGTASGGEDESPEAARWREEAERFQQLFRAEQLRVQELEEQLKQLQLIPVDHLNVPVIRMNARIVAGHPTSPTGSVTLRGGSQAGITIGTIAVHGGVHLLGQVVEVSPFSSRLRPLVSQATRDIQAVIVPADRLDTRLRDAMPVCLVARGDGTFVADGEAIWSLAEGDLICLADPAWPQAAQGMVVGTIRSVQVKDSEPLRNEIIIRPRYRLLDLSSVVLVVEQDPDAHRGAEGGGP